MNTVKFGIIGCGRIAERHAIQIQKFGTLVAVCDIIPEKAKAIAEKYNCTYYSSSEEMLAKQAKDIDVIAVCTPNGLHITHTIDSLKAGCHVLCEKPLAISVNDCGEMIKQAEKSNKRLFAIKQNRFNPPVAAVKQAIEDGKLGKLFSIQLSCFWNRNADYYLNSWKGTADLDGGTLYTQFSHFIDLLYWMIGDVKNVSAYTANYAHEGIIDFEDTGVVILEFYNGVIGTINYTVNSYQSNMEGSLTIFAEKGTVKIGGQYLNELEYQKIENFTITNLPEGNKPNNYGNYVGSMSNHDKVYENLVDVLVNGGSINTNAFEALKTVEIIDKIYREARKIR
jgi:UDP-N-acetyl-2-amino-2-deoxyglucuronate dehydrogenase